MTRMTLVRMSRANKPMVALQMHAKMARMFRPHLVSFTLYIVHMTSLTRLLYMKNFAQSRW